ncbi:hypothetical protein SPRG_07560 [Saprolegnia parasitica CBS 223.65]|uniref:Uncharacterized protein n=1 Tax=Saprolegnia parasitica (strain CBS 223.65) TaxID=695850 RepID=A0A067CL96_SAPPC|nr:hypothetical protein SPRG_07560 [Saprolegnia parasitica CBS 223.65]KDO27311.1 hypothetical protein SPRG_07560 [Saprolegnia parasitica CBS 223.65]|eukprot:XP_012202084.1 hypothetical protein SPRG_07560 [Saprolegnia parasitica CBS 223.65]
MGRTLVPQSTNDPEDSDMLARVLRSLQRPTPMAARAFSDAPKSFVPEHDKPHARAIIVDTVLDDDEDEDDYEEMVTIGPAGTEWGGPSRGSLHDF